MQAQCGEPVNSTAAQGCSDPKMCNAMLGQPCSYSTEGRCCSSRLNIQSAARASQSHAQTAAAAAAAPSQLQFMYKQQQQPHVRAMWKADVTTATLRQPAGMACMVRPKYAFPTVS